MAPDMLFVVADHDHPLRLSIEDEIKATYARAYGAEVHNFADLLVALIAADGTIACAAGLRLGEDPFFSERYLEDTIENALSDIWTANVKRSEIAEVSNLAALNPGHSMRLIGHIISLLRGHGIQWAFFTATGRLRAVLKRTGVPTLDLAPALADAAPHQVWGSYYATNPRVVALHDSMITRQVAETTASHA